MIQSKIPGAMWKVALLPSPVLCPSLAPVLARAHSCWSDLPALSPEQRQMNVLGHAATSLKCILSLTPGKVAWERRGEESGDLPVQPWASEFPSLSLNLPFRTRTKLCLANFQG